MKTHTELYQISQSAPKKGADPAMFLKIFCYSLIFTLMGMTLSSCAGGYVVTEPTYDIGYERPLPPSRAHIWIDGDWRWDHRSHAYVHDRGYWILPREGREYREGHWETGPRGKYWSKGYWERSKKQSVHRSHIRERDRDDNRDRRDRDHN